MRYCKTVGFCTGLVMLWTGIVSTTCCAQATDIGEPTPGQQPPLSLMVDSSLMKPRFQVEAGIGSVNDAGRYISVSFNARMDVIHHRLNPRWDLAWRLRFGTGGVGQLFGFGTVWIPVTLGAELALRPVDRSNGGVVSPYLVLQYGGNIWLNGGRFLPNPSRGFVYGGGIDFVPRGLRRAAIGVSFVLSELGAARRYSGGKWITEELSSFRLTLGVTFGLFQ